MNTQNISEGCFRISKSYCIGRFCMTAVIWSRKTSRNSSKAASTLGRKIANATIMAANPIAAPIKDACRRRVYWSDIRPLSPALFAAWFPSCPKALTFQVP